MGAKRRAARRPPEAPRDAVTGAAWARRYLIDLYDRRDGEAANWQLIAETAFKVGLDAIDAAPRNQRRIDTLTRLHAAAYERMTEASQG